MPARVPCTREKSYNAKECRLSTWRAMMKLFNDGDALAIGVSNYDSAEIQVWGSDNNLRIDVCVCV